MKKKHATNNTFRDKAFMDSLHMSNVTASARLNPQRYF